MAFKSIIGATCTCLVIVSFNADAELISADWKTSGDNLITRDSSSGLDWLNLTESTNLSYNYVSSQFDIGGQFEGWRYAKVTEVVALWLEFNIDLSASAPTTSLIIDPNVGIASTFLGNTFEGNSDVYGVEGFTDAEGSQFASTILGALVDESSVKTEYLTTIRTHGTLDMTRTFIGSYLVQVSPVPIPSAVWLFGSGLLGLIGLARRKVRV